MKDHDKKVAELMLKVKPKKGAGNGHRFKPGVSGNPAGRSRVIEAFRLTCRTLTDELCLPMWEAEVRAKGTNWMRCSEMIAQHGYGKPTQTIVATVTNRDERPMSEVLDEIRATREAIESFN